MNQGSSSMANEITTGRVHWSYGGHRLLIEHPMPATDDTLLPNSVTFTDFFREERTDALGIGGAILDRRLVVGGLRAGEQTGYSDWETCVNASIPVNWLLDWTPPRLDVDQSVAITLLKQFRLLLAPTEGEAAFSGPRGHHLAPRRQSLAMRLVATDRAQREQLVRELAHAFRAEPLEDGWTHPAEGLVADALSQPRAHEWLHAFCVGPTRIPDAASVLICLGRLDRPRMAGQARSGSTGGG